MVEVTLLTGDTRPVEIAPGGYSLQAPGLRGSVTAMSSSESATRAERGLYEESLRAAFANTGIRQGRVFEISVAEDRLPPARDTATRSDGLTATTRDKEPAVVLRVPDLGSTVDQAVLYTDESGVSRWIFPEAPATRSTATTRGSVGTLVFHLPREGVTPPMQEASTDESATRGPISKLGRRLVRVLAWATDDSIGQGALAVVRRWEEQHRPYALRAVTPGQIDGPVSWDLLHTGRALLLIHGTFSTAQASFSKLAGRTSEKLAEYYQGRVFAFDHPSLHQSPTENIQTLLQMLPATGKLDLDIIAHSRGGLVARLLAQHQADFQRDGRAIQVRKVVLVGTPNKGTVLTDGEHAITMLDRYTNLLTYLPDDAYTLTMEGILTVVKLVLHGALKALPGLQSMLPSGEFLERLNASTAHSTEYYALAADYTPTAPSLLARFGLRLGDRLVDGIFQEENDGVVPTRGVFEAGTDTHGFPIPPERRMVYDTHSQVHHCNYFATDTVMERLCSWMIGK